jgi:hypothetical protein
VVFWFLAALFIISAPLEAAKAVNDCRVPGTPAQWIAAYCMQKYESEDPYDSQVQNCLTDAVTDPAIKKYKMSECEQKIYRKKQICEIFGGDAAQKSKCSQDPNFVPLNVQQEMHRS